MANTPDKIHIYDLLLRTYVGINPEEQINLQDVIINVTMHVDLAKACRTDDVADTVDYKKVKQRIVRVVQENRYQLIERLAQAVADVCLEDLRVDAVEVCAEKPGALRFARSVGVEIARSRK